MADKAPGDAENRRIELERKKRKLAELRETKKRAQDDRTAQMLNATNLNGLALLELIDRYFN